ncbi:MAG: Gfo/Idh/MocA family oxidoreductase, partial [Eubacteriales bacterium]|nr:Gfo/Idh/MocA family oxidoreductase [Eubacteriales bacterium]
MENGLVDIVKKYRFIIVGSGWRSMYYVRAAKALPHIFSLEAMLCRTKEKAEKIAGEMDIHTTTSVEECERIKPDFVVVAVNKSSIGEVSKEWLSKGFTVLCETPPTVDENELRQLWRLHKEKGFRLCVAEQYFMYPSYGAILKVLEKGIIGEPYNVNISLAHEYHGASLMKKILHTEDETFTITGKKYTFPVKETANRYERFTDGRVGHKSRDVMTIEFESGKTAYYDFSSEQYRSKIRSNYLKVQGVSGELVSVDGLFTRVQYMNENNQPEEQNIVIDTRQLIMGDVNPNLNEVDEVVGISMGKGVKSTNLYTPRKEFGLCGLSEDETAVAFMMQGAGIYNEGGKELYPLKDALTDAYMAGLMQRALN